MDRNKSTYKFTLCCDLAVSREAVLVFASGPIEVDVEKGYEYMPLSLRGSAGCRLVCGSGAALYGAEVVNGLRVAGVRLDAYGGCLRLA